MKTICLVALLGAVSAVKVGSHFGGIATKWDEDHPHPGFPAGWDEDNESVEHLGKYSRTIPEQFDVEGAGGD